MKLQRTSHESHESTQIREPRALREIREIRGRPSTEQISASLLDIDGRQGSNLVSSLVETVLKKLPK